MRSNRLTSPLDRDLGKLRPLPNSLTSLPGTPSGFLVQFGQGAWEAIQRTGDSPQEALKRLQRELLPSDANREGCPDETTTDTTEPTSSEGQDPSDSSEGQDPSDLLKVKTHRTQAKVKTHRTQAMSMGFNNPADDENDDDEGPMARMLIRNRPKDCSPQMHLGLWISVAN